MDSARNLLRQSLRRRLRSMDGADGRRSIKARSLQRQCMLEAAAGGRKEVNEPNTKTPAHTSPIKPTRPAPPPPKKNEARGKTLPNFANLKDLHSTSSTAIDLNDSLRGPSVKFESASLIQVQKTDDQGKPKLPPKPKYLHNITKKPPSSLSEQAPPLPSRKGVVTSNLRVPSTSIPLRNLHPNTNEIDSFSDEDDDQDR